VVLDLPVPPSVNKTRKIDRVGHRLFMRWVQSCTPFVLAAKCRSENPLKLEKIKRFHIAVVLSEQHTTIDLDNSVKSLIDYLRHIEIIENDAQKNMRKLTVEWGLAPHGCRVTVKACA
jgi:Holliday junction resolvase RusA-like endonuclease